MIEQAIDRRGAFSVPMFDPVIIRLQAEYEPFQRFIERLYAALLGTEAGVEARLHAAMLSSAISVAVHAPTARRRRRRDPARAAQADDTPDARTSNAE